MLCHLARRRPATPPLLPAALLFLLALPGCPNYATVCTNQAGVVQQGGALPITLDCSFLEQQPHGGPFSGRYATEVLVANEAALKADGVQVSVNGSVIKLEADASAPLGEAILEYQIAVNGVPSERAEIALSVTPAPGSTKELRLVNAAQSRVKIGTETRQCDHQTCSFRVESNATIQLMAPPAGTPGVQCKWACTNGTFNTCDTTFQVTSDLSCELTQEHPNKRAFRVEVDGPGTASVFVDGGLSPVGECVNTTCFLDDKAAIRIVARANELGSFAGWSGGCTGTDPQVSLEVTTDTVCVATFKPLTQLQVELQDGTDLYAWVVADGAQISCPGDCDALVAPDSSVTLRVQRKPEINEALEVTWGGDCQGSANETQVTVDSDKMCTVTVRPIDVCAGAQAPATLALDVYVNSSPLVVDRSSGIAVVQVSRYSELSLDTSSTQVSSGVAATYTWEIGGQQWAIGPTTTWTASDPGTNSVTGVLRYSDNCGNTQTLEMRFDIGF